MPSPLAAGALALTWVAGHLAVRYGLPRARIASPLERHLLALAIGIALMTPLLVALAFARGFQVAWLSAAGWGALVLFLVAGRARGTRAAPRPDRYELAAIAMAVAFALVAYGGRQPALGTGRDQQVYAEYAVSLSKFGHAAPAFANLDAADRQLVDAAFASWRRSIDAFRDDMPGTAPSDRRIDPALGPYLPIAWAGWLALAHALGGMDLLAGANAIVMGLASLLVFAIARRLSDARFALAACALFCTLPLSLWVARIALSEPLALVLLLSVVLLVQVAPVRSVRLVPIVFFAACCVRVDALLAAPLFVAALLGDAMMGSSRMRTRHARRAARAIAATVVVTVIACAATFPPRYFTDVARFLVPVIAATLVLGGLAQLPTQWLRRAGSVVAAPSVSWIASAVLVGLFAYAATVRPSTQPYALIPYAGGLTGTRDFREDSLVNLAAYVGWPLLLVALGGACLALRDALKPGAPVALRAFAAISIGYAGLFLWFPHVSPDHPWAARRFVPVILPAIVLFATVAAHRVLRRARSGTTAIGWLALAAASGPAWAVQGLRPLASDGRSGDARIRAIADALPPTLVVADGRLANLGTALFVAHGKPVLSLHFRNPESRALIDRWLAAKARAGAPAWLLQESSAARAGARTIEAARWTISGKHLAPRNRAPATRIVHDSMQVALLRVEAVDRAAASRMFGGEPLWGVREHGFGSSEVAPFGQFRYTDGGAWLGVPAGAWDRARALKVDLFAHAEPGDTRWVRVLVNRHAIWERRIAGGVTSVVAPIPTDATVGDRDTLVEIWSQTESLPAGGTAIGVGVIGLRPLRGDEAREATASMTGFRSALAPVGNVSGIDEAGGADPGVDLDIANRGSVVWPSIAELGSVTGAVQIGLRWYRADAPGTIVGDNRWAMSISLYPGDQTRVRVPLVPRGLTGRRLPAGDYDVRIGMVREGYAWFADDGDTLLRLPVKVRP